MTNSISALLKKIILLDKRVDESIRKELYLCCLSLHKTNSSSATILQLSRLSLKLLKLIITAANATPPKGDNLNDYINFANKDKDGKGLKILPDELASNFHSIRIFSNKQDHDQDKIELKIDDATTKINQYLRILEWFYVETPLGPQLKKIYSNFSVKSFLIGKKYLVVGTLLLLVIILFSITIMKTSKNLLITYDKSSIGNFYSHTSQSILQKALSKSMIFRNISTVDTCEKSLGKEKTNSYTYILNLESEFNGNKIIASLYSTSNESSSPLFSIENTIDSLNYNRLSTLILLQCIKFFELYDDRHQLEISDKAIHDYILGEVYKLDDSEKGLANSRDYFEAANGADPNNYRILGNVAYTQFYYGSLYDQTNKFRWFERSENNANKALKLNEHSLQAYVVLGNIYKEKNLMDRAKKYYLKALEYNPTEILALTEVGSLYLDIDADSSIFFLSRANQTSPGDAIILSNLGTGYAYKGDFKRALEYFNDSQKYNTHDLNTMINRAVLEERLNNLNGSKKLYSQIINYDKNSSEAELSFINLSTILLIEGNFSDVIPLLDSALKINSKNIVFIYLYSLAKLRAGDKMSANNYFNSCLRNCMNSLEKYPSDNISRIYACLSLIRLNKGKEALSLLTPLTSLSDNEIDSENACEIARVYSMLTDRVNCLKWITIAKKKNGNFFTEEWLRTALDFENFKNDQEFISILRR